MVLSVSPWLRIAEPFGHVGTRMGPQQQHGSISGEYQKL